MSSTWANQTIIIIISSQIFHIIFHTFERYVLTLLEENDYLSLPSTNKDCLKSQENFPGYCKY